MRLAVIASHPIQYQAPIFRALAKRFDLVVFFAHYATPADQAKAGFGVGFEWDVDLLSGYAHVFLHNIAKRPGVDHFAGCDTPEIGAYLRTGAFDALLVQGWHLKTFLQATLAGKRQGLPVLVRGDSNLLTPRSAPKTLAKAILCPAFFRVFDAALYVGERSRAYWTHYRYPEARLFFSPHCIDTEWFAARATPESRTELRARLGLTRDAKVALFAGKLVPFKRPLDLVFAATRLKQKGLEIAILVAGAGPLGNEMASAAQAAGLVFYPLGFCNQTRMPPAYAAADVLVLPSDGQETWGLVANEALACGKPIVVSDAAGCAPDLVGDGAAGRVFALADIEALAAALSDVMDRPPAAVGIAAKSTAYSIDAAADGIFRAVGFTLKNKCRAAA